MNIGVIFAGGVGSRAKSANGRPKQFIEILNKPIIIYTLEHFQYCSDIDKIVIACIKDWIPFLEQQIAKFGITKVEKVVPGGRSGQESIYNGLMAAKEVGDENAVVLIHDGVRPMISSALLSDAIKCVKENGNAVTTAKVVETIVTLNEDGTIREIPDRASCAMARAPQCFYLNEILESHHKAIAEGKDNFIDSCSMMRYYGHKIHTIEGPSANIKITTPEDFYIMKAILEVEENRQIYGLE